MSKNIKKIIKLSSFIIAFLIFSTNIVFSAGLGSDVLDNATNTGGTDANQIATAAGYSTTVTAQTMFNRVIQIILGLSGTASLILIIMSGIYYLMSKGDPTKMKKALKIMGTGFIGLVIIASAYTISNYIIEQSQRVVGTPNTTPVDRNPSSGDGDATSGGSGSNGGVSASNPTPTAEQCAAKEQSNCGEATGCVYVAASQECVVASSVPADGNCDISATNQCIDGYACVDVAGTAKCVSLETACSSAPNESTCNSMLNGGCIYNTSRNACEEFDCNINLILVDKTIRESKCVASGCVFITNDVQPSCFPNKRPNGSRCDAGQDEECVSNICEINPSAPTQYLCVDKLQDEVSCTKDLSCKSGKCLEAPASGGGKICVTPRDNGGACEQDDWCKSGLCNIGKCVAKNSVQDSKPCNKRSDGSPGDAVCKIGSSCKDYNDGQICMPLPQTQSNTGCRFAEYEVLQGVLKTELSKCNEDGKMDNHNRNVCQSPATPLCKSGYYVAVGIDWKIMNISVDGFAKNCSTLYPSSGLSDLVYTCYGGDEAYDCHVCGINK